MKNCWRCAEQIQDAAVACRFCGANQASLDRTKMLSDEIDADIRNRRQRVRFVAIVAIFIFCLWLGERIFGGSVPPVAIQSVEIEPEPEAVKSPRFSTTSIEAAKAAISKEPKVIDLLYDESNAIEWHIAVADDGSRRYGYAQYICIILSDAGASDDDVAVRIVDAAKRAQFKDSYRDYSLGAVRCADGQFLD